MTHELPPDDEILSIIDCVAKGLAHKYTFGYYDVEDIEQEARLIALDRLNKYTGQASLKTFLWSCVSNQLSNMKRDKYERIVSPCHKCRLNNTSKCLADSCVKFSRWRKLNDSKKGLMSPVFFDNVDDEHESNMHTDDLAIPSELIALLDKCIPLELRRDYLRAKMGARLPKHRRLKLKEAILSILEENSFDLAELGIAANG